MLGVGFFNQLNVQSSSFWGALAHLDEFSKRTAVGPPERNCHKAEFCSHFSSPCLSTLLLAESRSGQGRHIIFFAKLFLVAIMGCISWLLDCD